MHNMFYRNVRAREHLQLFLITAVGTVLAQRLFLYLTDYPQLGAGSLHIAHMLYGGVLMMAAIVLTMSFLGERIQHFSALVGGIGFGLFIDELGKFITKDNNYFFRPTIGLIYALFVIIFLIFNYLGREEVLTDREYELNALNQFEEAILQDLDPAEKQRIVHLLAQVHRPTHITHTLKHMLSAVETVPVPEPKILQKLFHRVTKYYASFWVLPGAKRFISFVFVAQAFIYLGTVAYAIVNSFDSAIGLNASNDAYGNRLIIANLVSSTISTMVAIAGAYQLFKDRDKAFDLFRTSLLINIFLSEFFLFSRVQFAALPSFTFNILLLIALRLAQYQEKQIVGQRARAAAHHK
ncbi:MAG: hypothetical protein QFB86_01870 [Patescibacteria group bacterium]|nr:hypothetical protein [Patescibacteria group bacterium]